MGYTNESNQTEWQKMVCVLSSVKKFKYNFNTQIKY